MNPQNGHSERIGEESCQSKSQEDQELRTTVVGLILISVVTKVTDLIVVQTSHFFQKIPVKTLALSITVEKYTVVS